MVDDDRITALERKLERWREDDKKRYKKERFENFSFVSWGFSLATLGLATAMVNGWAMYVMAGLFLFLGFYANNHSKKI